MDNGEFNKITTPYLINQIRRSEKGFNLELVNYDTAIYETGTIPEYKSNITQKQTDPAPEIPKDYATKRDVAEAIDNLESGKVPVGKPDIPTLVAAVAGKDGLTLSCVQNGDGIRNTLRAIVFTIDKGDGTTATITANGKTGVYTFDREVDGYPEAGDFSEWSVTARAVSIYGKESDESEAALINVSKYGTWTLAAPVITKRESNRTITLYFQQPTRSDGKALRKYYAPRTD